MIKLSTINQIVEAILQDIPIPETNRKLLANDAVIYYKTAMICEEKGIDEAMKYYSDGHDPEEYQEFRTGVVENNFEEEGGFAPDSDYEIRKCNINEKGR